jgi:hypothetical protein
MLAGMNAPTQRQGTPFRPDFRQQAVSSLARACIGLARNRLDPTVTPRQHIRSAWPDDRTAAQLVERASSDPPLNLSNAGPLAHLITGEFVASLGPLSAGVRLFEAGLQLSLDGVAAISLPQLVADATKASFVAELSPIPVRQLVTQNSAQQLLPKKLAVIAVLTREMAESSNAESLFTDCLKRSAALALDAALFGSSAASAAAPAGLRNGIVALTPSSNTDSLAAMLEDIGALVGAVSVLSAEPPILIASTARALMMEIRSAHTLDPLTVVGSSAVAANDLICVSPAAFVSALGSTPEITVNREAEMVMDDVPPQIASGSPGVMASPTISLFQGDKIALKLRFPTGWALRDPRGVAWLTTTKWTV